MQKLWSVYGKALVAVLFAAFTALQAAVFDGHISQVEAVQIAIATATAVGVWLAPELPHAVGVKLAVAVVLAVLNVLVTVIIGGLSSSDLTELILAALTVAGVRAVPAQSVVPPSATARAR